MFHRRAAGKTFQVTLFPGLGRVIEWGCGAVRVLPTVNQ